MTQDEINKSRGRTTKSDHATVTALLRKEGVDASKWLVVHEPPEETVVEAKASKIARFKAKERAAKVYLQQMPVRGYSTVDRDEKNQLLCLSDAGCRAKLKELFKNKPCDTLFKPYLTGLGHRLQAIQALKLQSEFLAVI